jgi:HEPN domain-containing protein
MNRNDFQILADMRVREAEALLAAGHYSGAFYLAGYAVECALKSCIAKQTKEHDFPPDPKFVREIYVHNLAELLSKVGVEFKKDFDEARNGSARFESNWAVVKDWSEDSRYTVVVSEYKARALFDAITAKDNGILPWLKKRW